MFDLTYMWNVKNKRNKQTKQNENRLTDTWNKWVAARGKRIAGGRGDGQKRQRGVKGTNLSYKINKSWVCNL